MASKPALSRVMPATKAGRALLDFFKQSDGLTMMTTTDEFAHWHDRILAIEAEAAASTVPKTAAELERLAEPMDLHVVTRKAMDGMIYPRVSALDVEWLARAIEGVWPVAADANEALEERDEGRGYVRLWPTDRLVERIAAEYARLTSPIVEVEE